MRHRVFPLGGLLGVALETSESHSLARDRQLAFATAKNAAVLYLSLGTLNPVNLMSSLYKASTLKVLSKTLF